MTKENQEQDEVKVDFDDTELLSTITPNADLPSVEVSPVVDEYKRALEDKELALKKLQADLEAVRLENLSHELLPQLDLEGVDTEFADVLKDKALKPFADNIAKFTNEKVNKAYDEVNAIKNELQELRKFKEDYTKKQIETNTYINLDNEFKNKFGISFTDYQKTHEGKDLLDKEIVKDTNVTYRTALVNAVGKGDTKLAKQIAVKMVKNYNALPTSNIPPKTQSNVGKPKLKVDKTIDYLQALSKYNNGEISENEYYSKLATLQN